MAYSASMLQALLPLTAALSTGLTAPLNAMTQDTPTLGPTAAPGATAPKTGDEVAVLTTSVGRVVVAFRTDKAPNHVKNFSELAKKGFYDGTRFHRCIPGFMVQGGDPNSKDLAQAGAWGTGGPGYMIEAEFNDLKHTRGILSMARSSNPDSAGSQFFLMVAEAPSLDRQYSAFGIVIEGMDVVDKIVATGQREGNGKVEPEKAVVLQKVEIKTWPLEG